MRHVLLAALAVIFPVSASDAAIYRYDISMELAELSSILFGFGNGQDADPKIAGISCTEFVDEDGVQHSCEGLADFSENRYGIDFLESFPLFFSASLRLDTALNRPPDFYEDDFFLDCTGSDFLCEYLSSSLVNFTSQDAGPDGFFISYVANSIFEFDVSDKGLAYSGDDLLDFTLGNTIYTNGPSGVFATYETTSFEVAPIPLPASLPLLIAGVAGIGFASGAFSTSTSAASMRRRRS